TKKQRAERTNEHLPPGDLTFDALVQAAVKIGRHGRGFPRIESLPDCLLAVRKLAASPADFDVVFQHGGGSGIQSAGAIVQQKFLAFPAFNWTRHSATLLP